MSGISKLKDRADRMLIGAIIGGFVGWIVGGCVVNKGFIVSYLVAIPFALLGAAIAFFTGGK